MPEPKYPVGLDDTTGLYTSLGMAEARKPKIRIAQSYGDPALDRAVNLLRQYYQKQIDASKIQPMNWPDSASDYGVEGSTFPDNDVFLNRGLLALAPQAHINEVMAHELTHVGQNQRLADIFAGHPDELKKLQMYEMLVPYAFRPSEVESFNTSRNLMKLLLSRMPQNQALEQTSMPPYSSNLWRALPEFRR